MEQILQWFSENWTGILGGLLAIMGGLYVPVLRGFVIASFKVLLSEAVLKKLFIAVAEKLVKSTKNTLDDIWLEELKKVL